MSYMLIVEMPSGKTDHHAIYLFMDCVRPVVKNLGEAIG